MNENIDLAKILKNCPKGTKLYTTIWGEVNFVGISENVCSLYPIRIYNEYDYVGLTKDGRYLINRKGAECILFPSKEQRDWSKFTAPWYNKNKFDPMTLKPFDKIIARVEGGIWFCELLSFIEQGRNLIKGFVSYYNYCIPYNDETKHLVGTTEEAPEYYRYWEY